MTRGGRAAAQLERAHRRLRASPTASPASSAPATRAAEAGGRIVALTMPILVPMNMSFLNFCALFLIPGWGDVLGLPIPERIAKLRDPEVRARMLEQSPAARRPASSAAGRLRQLRHR